MRSVEPRMPENVAYVLLALVAITRPPDKRDQFVTGAKRRSHPGRFAVPNKALRNMPTRISPRDRPFNGVDRPVIAKDEPAPSRRNVRQEYPRRIGKPAQPKL